MFDFLHAVVVAGSVTWCLLGACSLPDLNTPLAMDSGSINISKDRIELHPAVNVDHVSSRSRLPGWTWGRGLATHHLVLPILDLEH